MKAAVIVCVLGLAFAQDNNVLQKFKGRFSWNFGDLGTDSNSNSKDGGTTGTGTGTGTETETGTGTSTNVCLADQAACGCCLMHQMIDRMKTNFNHSLTELQGELNKAMDLLKQFRSSRSAFSVALFTDSTKKCYGPFRDDTLVKYKHIFLNMGNHYDDTTGIFTAPRTGVYSLSLTVYSDVGGPGNSLAACAALQVNGRKVTAPREVGMQDSEDSASNSIVIKLQLGDKVTINLPIGCFLCDDKNHYNTFSGFLLYMTE